MSIKISHEHALKLLFNQDYYKVIDAFLYLIKISKMKNINREKKYIIQMTNDSETEYRLPYIILDNIPSIKTKATANSIIDLLIKEDMIHFNDKLNSWEIPNMFNMLKDGSLEVKALFYTDDFYSLSYLEKKTLLYVVYIMSTEEYKRTKVINLDVLSKDNLLINIYYNRDKNYINKQIQSVIEKYFIVIR